MPKTESRIDMIRRFNRFYTKQVGALNEGLLKSPFSLTEMRILYELNAHEGLSAIDLVRELSLDPAYLSRILKKFKHDGLLKTRRSENDGRQWLLSMTEKGRDVFAPYIKASRDEVAAMLAPLDEASQQKLAAAMHQILLTFNAEEPVPVTLRAHKPGDMGWVIHRHGALYAEEYDFDETFEALVAGVAADFINNFDPEWEHCWIAERADEILGSIFLVKKDETTAKLRLLYVEPSARGLGVGRKLVTACLDFARAKGYKTVTLWTNSILHAAIHLYEEAGFKLMEEEAHHSFGQDLIGQNWDLEL
ncbi:MAG: MarR family transcriptional regulator [Alphaproteobacteria bacterium]|nr:MAG: MarR family transcriptional regulator [Alphaproteobacteria bacterium]